jgi:hypothetical protein
MNSSYKIYIPAQDPLVADYWGNGWRDSIAWCNDHVGKYGLTWWFVPGGTFHFVRDQDRTMFVLRWS